MREIITKANQTNDSGEINQRLQVLGKGVMNTILRIWEIHFFWQKKYSSSSLIRCHLVESEEGGGMRYIFCWIVREWEIHCWENEKYIFLELRNIVHHHHPGAIWRKAKKKDTSSADKILPLMEVSGSAPQIGMSKVSRLNMDAHSEKSSLITACFISVILPYGSVRECSSKWDVHPKCQG